MKKLFLTVAAGGVLALCSPVLAQEEHREAGAHMHGHGTLNMAIEGNKVAMELVAPGSDIVGFEHEASTDEQKAKVKAAIETLEKGAGDLFAFSEAAKCIVSSAKAEVESMGEHDDHDHGKEAKKDDHDHDHDHEKEAKKDDHDHDHEKEASHEGEAEHSEFHAAYELECAAPGELRELNVQFFKKFPSSKELAVTVVDGSGGKTHEATPDAPVVKLGK